MAAAATQTAFDHLYCVPLGALSDFMTTTKAAGGTAIVLNADGQHAAVAVMDGVKHG